MDPTGRSRGFGLAHAGVRALATEVAGQEREHAHRARGRLAVAVALQAPALHDVDAIGLVQLAGELADGLGGNERDLGGPLGRLLDLVVAGSHDVVVVRLVMSLGRCGHGLLVVALAVPMQEVEVDPALLDELVGDAGDECRVRARANGQPFLRMTSGCLVITVIDVDNLGTFLAHARVVPDHVGTTHAIVRRRVANIKTRSALPAWSTDEALTFS